MVSRAQHCAAVDAAVPATIRDSSTDSITSVHAQSQAPHQLDGDESGGHVDGDNLDVDGNTSAHAVCCTPAAVHHDSPHSSRSSTPPALTLAHFEAAVDGFTPASLRGVRYSLCTIRNHVFGIFYVNVVCRCEESPILFADHFTA